jgi:hypothetical protein
MYLNRSNAREISRVALRHLSLRRALVWLGYTVGFVAIRGLLDVTRWIDDLLWPEIATLKVEKPVFIFGNARSGTTMLHRLMSLDEDHFTSMKLYQSIFCRVSLYRGVAALDRLDRRLPGRPLRHLVDLVNRKVFHTWRGIHEMGLDKAEEDEAIFALTLMTPAVALLLPHLQEMPGLASFDDLPAGERRRFMDHYEDALRRHLFASGGERTFLNKNALLAPRLRTILERFPDAQFVYLVRHPFEAIPSFLDMFHEKWLTHSPEIGSDSPEASALAELAVDYYRYALDCRRFIPEDQFIAIRYDDLVANPREVVEVLYRQLGIEMGPAYRARLEAAQRAQHGFTSSHRYSLEQFGLSEMAIYTELKDIFTEFGFEPPNTSLEGGIDGSPGAAGARLADTADRSPERVTTRRSAQPH